MTFAAKLPAVGLIGLGNLGRPIAETLLDAGHDLTVVDRNADLVAQCGTSGARPAASPADLADTDVLAVAVNDDAAVTDVVVDSGLLERLRPGAVVVVHSTVLPETARQLATRAQQCGVEFLDAPVSGGAERARAGALAVFAGGSSDALAAAKPYLETIASHVTHVGEAGAGSAAKLGNQLLMFGALAAAYDALELAGSYGVSEQVLMDAVQHGTGDCWIAQNWGFFDRTATEYDASELPLRMRPWSKDLWDTVAAARSQDLRLPVAGLLAQLMPDRVEAHAAAMRKERP